MRHTIHACYPHKDSRMAVLLWNVFASVLVHPSVFAPSPLILPSRTCNRLHYIVYPTTYSTYLLSNSILLLGCVLECQVAVGKPVMNMRCRVETRITDSRDTQECLAVNTMTHPTIAAHTNQLVSDLFKG